MVMGTEVRAGNSRARRPFRVTNPNESSSEEERFPSLGTGLDFSWLPQPSPPPSSDRESPPHDLQEPIYAVYDKTNQPLHPSSSPPISTVPFRNPPKPIPPPPVTSPAPPTSSSPNPTQAIADKTLILVTSDSSLYANVEITGAPSAAFIREKIFTALNIFDAEEQARYSIYRTEIGQYAIGDALTDDRLFELCRASGDSKGSLKLLVSHSFAAVHDPSYRPPIQPAHAVTPPVLPQQSSPLPQSHPPPALQPRRQSSRSRHGSVSSTSEHAGYEADHENPVRENGHRNTIRPSPNQAFNCIGVSAPLPSSPLANHPLATRRPSAPHQSRPATPPVPIPTSLQIDRNKERERERDRDTIIDKYGNVLQMPPPPPPLSPNRLTFDDKSSTARPHTHTRVGSETAAEKQNVDWRSRPRAEPTGIPIGHRRPVKQSSDHSSSGREQSWVLVDANQPTSQENTNSRRSPATSRTARHQITSPQRHNKPYSPSGRLIPPPPRNEPPPVPNGVNDTHGKMLSPSRAGGQYVPANWPVSWRPEQKMKGAKSTGDLRNLFASSSSNLSSANHPSTLLPGGSPSERSKRPPPANPPPNAQLPPRPNGLPTAASTTALNTSRPIRPLPVSGGPSHSVSMEFTPSLNNRSFASALSPNQEPYPRPQSALGHDTPTSPVQRSQRPYESPTGDSTQSPRAFSPTHHLPLPSNPAIRSTHSLIPLPTPPQPPRSSPPRSPTSPRSPPSRLTTSISESSSTTSPPSASPSEHDVGTFKEGKDFFQRFLLGAGTGTGTGTAMTITRPSGVKPLPVTPVGPPPPSNPYDTSSTGTMLSMSSATSSDSDDYGSGTWQKLPTDKVIQRRPSLTIKTDAASPTSATIVPRIHPLPIPNPNASSTRDDIATLMPGHQRRSSASRKDKEAKARLRGSTFTAAESDWAPRPPPEDMYERLEEFFPEHDLDRPVIEASSGGTSPTTVEIPPVPPVSPVVEPTAKVRIKGKKSIRIVAEEHKKRIDRTSRALMAGGATDSESTFMNNMARKRSTKLWGSKVEEVSTKAIPSHPESSPGGPTTFKWVRGELIGKGTYGRVYLALNATTGEMMAVKQVDLPRTPSDRNDTRQTTVVQALKLESETLKDLDHPNIVQYLGFEETPANLSIFLEYVPGGSVGSVLLKHGKLSEPVTISFTAQILSGLEYLHSRGILHRDLKADNILVEMGGVCKISDFGISKRTAESDGAGTAMQGTVYWMAPEVINPQGKSYNFKVDIWSLGCVVLEMLAGVRPWTGAEMFAVLIKLYQEKTPPPVPEGVVLSELADDFVRTKCFAINPDERPTAAELRKHKYLELPPGWQFSGFS
ncbi:mitogen-activated protein kinase kinase kinase [Marasmius tenuissimus]|uniref:Mitogen-activated protein kinase kinase kinase n=1 Tax=Marasmius tenuissimus TaxID=585030 RepID=A0ABR3AG19_9AGAR|nr:mitogen-activated protein kinase kinase kinase [Marasmius tenuissimus]